MESTVIEIKSPKKGGAFPDGPAKVEWQARLDHAANLSLPRVLIQSVHEDIRHLVKNPHMTNVFLQSMLDRLDVAIEALRDTRDRNGRLITDLERRMRNPDLPEAA